MRRRTDLATAAPRLLPESSGTRYRLPGGRAHDSAGNPEALPGDARVHEVVRARRYPQPHAVLRGLPGVRLPRRPLPAAGRADADAAPAEQRTAVARRAGTGRCLGLGYALPRRLPAGAATGRPYPSSPPHERDSAVPGARR